MIGWNVPRLVNLLRKDVPKGIIVVVKLFCCYQRCIDSKKKQTWWSDLDRNSPSCCCCSRKWKDPPIVYKRKTCDFENTNVQQCALQIDVTGAAAAHIGSWTFFSVNKGKHETSLSLRRCVHYQSPCDVPSLMRTADPRVQE